MVIIVTGAIGIGKTTVCKEVVEIVRSQGYSCGGIITYKIRNEDIVIEDIRTGTTNHFASTQNVYTGPRTEKYCFNPEGIEFGIQAIEKGISSDVLVVDEIGQLELGGQGFAKIIKQIGTDDIKNCILVIRKTLLSDFLPRLGVRTLIFETTIDNRNQLPMEISQILSRVITQKSILYHDQTYK
jgi:iron complex transport system ATP-binding protein